MSFVQFEPKMDTISCVISLQLFVEVSVPYRAGIIKIWMDESVAQHSAQCWCQKFCFYGKEILVSHLFCSIFFKAVGSPDHRPQANLRMLFYFCIFTFYIQFSSILRLYAEKIDLALSSPKCILNLLSANQSQIFSKSLFSIFSMFYIPMLVHGT